MKKKKTKIIIAVISVLLILGIGLGVKVHMDNEIKQEQKEKELKIIEDEIVADLAKRYKGIESVQFYEYTVIPTGTLSIPLTINHMERENYTEDYEMSVDEKHPRLSGHSRKPIAEKGTSDIKKIKVTYSFKEFGK